MYNLQTVEEVNDDKLTTIKLNTTVITVPIFCFVFNIITYTITVIPPVASTVIPPVARVTKYHYGAIIYMSTYWANCYSCCFYTCGLI